MTFNLEELKELAEQMKRMGIDTISELIEYIKRVYDTFYIEKNHIHYAEFNEFDNVHIEVEKGYAIKFENELIGNWIQLEIVETG